MKVIRKVRQDGKSGPLFYGFNDNNKPVFRYQSQAPYGSDLQTYNDSKSASATLTKINKQLKKTGTKAVVTDGSNIAAW